MYITIYIVLIVLVTMENVKLVSGRGTLSETESDEIHYSGCIAGFTIIQKDDPVTNSGSTYFYCAMCGQRFGGYQTGVAVYGWCKTHSSCMMRVVICENCSKQRDVGSELSFSTSYTNIHCYRPKQCGECSGSRKMQKLLTDVAGLHVQQNALLIH